MTQLQGLRAFWSQLALRERRLLTLAATLVLLALVWLLGVQPAWRTLRAAPGQFAALELQLQTMQGLAEQAKAVQNRPAVSRELSSRTLQSTLLQQLGTSAQLSVAGSRVTVTLKDAAPDRLAQWLVQARTDARAQATQANLTRGASGWNGTLVFDLSPAS